MTNTTNPIRCPDCDGGLDGGDLAYGLVCNACGVRVAGPFADANDVPDYASEAEGILLLARGCGRQARRANRSLSRTVQDAIRSHPELAGHEPDIKLGWYAERAEQFEDGDASTIGGGL